MHNDNDDGDGDDIISIEHSNTLNKHKYYFLRLILLHIRCDISICLQPVACYLCLGLFASYWDRSMSTLNGFHL